jgi:hypothetical protein
MHGGRGTKNALGYKRRIWDAHDRHGLTSRRCHCEQDVEADLRESGERPKDSVHMRIPSIHRRPRGLNKYHGYSVKDLRRSTGRPRTRSKGGPDLSLGRLVRDLQSFGTLKQCLKLYTSDAFEDTVGIDKVWFSHLVQLLDALHHSVVFQDASPPSSWNAVEQERRQICDLGL